VNISHVLNLEGGVVMNTRIYTGSDHRSVIPYVQCGCIKFFIEGRVYEVRVLVIMFALSFMRLELPFIPGRGVPAN
jgi:hypothetical protein